MHHINLCGILFNSGRRITLFICLSVFYKENLTGNSRDTSPHSWMTSLIKSLMYTIAPRPGGFKLDTYWHGTKQTPNNIGNN
jgi:hypothetical protein